MFQPYLASLGRCHLVLSGTMLPAVQLVAPCAQLVQVLKLPVPLGLTQDQGCAALPLPCMLHAVNSSLNQAPSGLPPTCPQSRWLADVLNGSIKLPPQEQLEADIAKQQVPGS